jgi:hypothetical protein
MFVNVHTVTIIDIPTYTASQPYAWNKRPFECLKDRAIDQPLWHRLSMFFLRGSVRPFPAFFATGNINVSAWKLSHLPTLSLEHLNLSLNLTYVVLHSLLMPIYIFRYPNNLYNYVVCLYVCMFMIDSAQTAVTAIATFVKDLSQHASLMHLVDVCTYVAHAAATRRHAFNHETQGRSKRTVVRNARSIETHGCSKRTVVRNARLFETHGCSKRTVVRNARLFETHGCSKRIM